MTDKDDPRAALVSALRDFEATLWQYINDQESDDERRSVTEWIARELTRVQQNLATEISIVGHEIPAVPPSDSVG